MSGRVSLLSLCRYRELKEKLDSLQKSSAQRDRTEVLLEQKEKDCGQVCMVRTVLLLEWLSHLKGSGGCMLYINSSLTAKSV